VAVGGVGGSGTRIVADMLARAGCYMGSDLNRSLDNLWFTFLFKRSRFMGAEASAASEIRALCRIFEKAMTRRGRFTVLQNLLLMRVAAERVFFERREWLWGNKVERAKWSFQRAQSMKQAVGQPGEDAWKGWGWKEPNTQFLLEPLSEYFSGLKYIHVIRHGLDMAFSTNSSQFMRWSGFFGIEKDSSPEGLPRSKLGYWIKANDMAIETGKRTLGSRFLVVSFDRLCLYPEEAVRELLEFLEVAPGHDLLGELSALPKVPKSMGRYKKKLGIFSEKEKSEVRRFGFAV
jgi:hypothetical protein